MIGLGTGRCGTLSLARLLDSQPGARVSHELEPLLPWIVDQDLLNRRLAGWPSSDATLSGDVAFFYLPYVERIAAARPDVRFICLRRDRTETVRSFLEVTEQRNHWTAHGGRGWRPDPRYDPCMPKYDIEDRAEAIGRYRDDYYSLARDYESLMPGFRIFETEVLNQRDGVEELLDFIGVEEKVVSVGVRVNRSRYRRARRLGSRLFGPLIRAWSVAMGRDRR